MIELEVFPMTENWGGRLNVREGEVVVRIAHSGE
jgi:hypothetical protein